MILSENRFPLFGIMLIVLGRPGSDLLFQALRLSTIGAKEFNGRVRDGIGFRPLAKTTRPAKDDSGIRKSGVGNQTNTDFDLWKQAVCSNQPIRRLISDC